MIDVTETLDVTGLACPMPVVKAKLAIDKLPKGAVLRVLATDRGALSDIPAWAKATGHTLLEVHDGGERLEFLIERG